VVAVTGVLTFTATDAPTGVGRIELVLASASRIDHRDAAAAAPRHAARGGRRLLPAALERRCDHRDLVARWLRGPDRADEALVPDETLSRSR